MTTTVQQATVRELAERCKPPGVYFDLPEMEYRKDPSLGSSDTKLLRNSPRLYQSRSWMNPKFRPTTTNAQLVGTALHMIVLEGVEKFSQHYVRRPDSYADLSPTDKGKMTKALNAELAGHQSLLSADEYDLCLGAAQDIADHDDMRESLKGGINEVSFFWRDPRTGVPCKGRADRLKGRGIGDLKSIANEKLRPLDIAAMLDIKSYRYDIQAAHYLTGLPIALKTGKMFGANAAAVALIERVKTSIANGDFAYQLLFLQKSAAEVWSTVLSPENHIIRVATDHCQVSLEMFRSLYERFGTERWKPHWRLGELHTEDMPGGDNGWY